MVVDCEVSSENEAEWLKDDENDAEASLESL